MTDPQPESLRVAIFDRLQSIRVARVCWPAGWEAASRTYVTVDLGPRDGRLLTTGQPNVIRARRNIMGEPNSCHANAAKVFLSRGLTISTGWACNGDQWGSHTFARDGATWLDRGQSEVGDAVFTEDLGVEDALGFAITCLGWATCCLALEAARRNRPRWWRTLMQALPATVAELLPAEAA